MGHGNSDRLHVTRDEMSGIYGDHTAGGGRRVKASDVGYERLPFDCCALSLQPWSNPVCSISDGTIFELTNIIPFLRKHGVSPATGVKLEPKDLVRLHFAKNAKGKYHDPVSFKEFNEHSHIVAICPSGNVFSYDTIQQLNVKAKHMYDLVEDTPFTKKDLLTLQDPHNMEGRDVNNLHHIKSALKWSKELGDADEVNTGVIGSAQKLLKSLGSHKSDETDTRNGEETTNTKAAHNTSARSSDASLSTSASASKLPYNATSATTGMMAASFTSSGLSVQTKSERQLVNEEEYMFEQVAAGQGLSKSKGSKRIKGLVRMETNFGPLDIELHIDKAPKTCYNFLELCKTDRYTDTVFHRLIPGFMVQGGDPTGTGRGGESVWGQPFRDEIDVAGAYRHTHRGTISMANKGPSTNGSQWFIAFRKLPHLDSKHTVFGQLVEEHGREAAGDQGPHKGCSRSMATLEKLEAVPTESCTDKPLRSVRVLTAYVLENPFEEWKTNLARRLARENMSEQELQAREAKRRKREDDRTTWLGTTLGGKDNQSNDETQVTSLPSSRNGVGKYIQQGNEATQMGRNKQLKDASAAQQSAATAGAAKKRKANAGSFGDFSSW